VTELTVEKNLFEDQQEQLEFTTERLSKFLEEPVENLSKKDIINYSALGARRCRGLFDVIMCSEAAFQEVVTPYTSAFGNALINSSGPSMQIINQIDISQKKPIEKKPNEKKLAEPLVAQPTQPVVEEGKFDHTAPGYSEEDALSAALKKSEETVDPEDQMLQQVIMQSSKETTHTIEDSELQRVLEMSIVEK